ncbi:MAG: polysaccharide deacetylase family protein [Deltaproteobacteria bacterium]|nr:polysaccharide deacetylase family protein [Deltaproteobacteria bacterium]
MRAGSSIPVLTYHGVAPGRTIVPSVLETHLRVLREGGYPALLPAELDSAASGVLVTFDDGFADVWTTVLPLLERYELKATVFAIPGRAGEGPRRSPEEVPPFSEREAHREASAGGAHPAFLRWSELQALEASGRVRVESHSYSHRMGWVGDEPVGFHLSSARSHWSLAQCTGGDTRLGIPLYRRGSALGHRLYRDDAGLRDRLAGWLEERGGAAYLEARGAARVGAELRAEAGRHPPAAGRWESDDERRRRTLEDVVTAREALEERLGGRREELCLPWGEYDGLTLEYAREAGIRRVYTLERDPNPAGRIGFLVNRFEPRPKGGSWLRTRLWIYRSVVRTRFYRLLSRR